MRIIDWSSDVCSSDLFGKAEVEPKAILCEFRVEEDGLLDVGAELSADHFVAGQMVDVSGRTQGKGFAGAMKRWGFGGLRATHGVSVRSEEHTSELQSLMRISYAVFCLKKKHDTTQH